MAAPMDMAGMMMAPDMSMGMSMGPMSMASMAMAPGLDTAPAMAPESPAYGQTIPLSKVRPLAQRLPCLDRLSNLHVTVHVSMHDLLQMHAWEDHLSR